MVHWKSNAVFFHKTKISLDKITRPGAFSGTWAGIVVSRCVNGDELSLLSSMALACGTFTCRQERDRLHFLPEKNKTEKVFKIDSGDRQ